MEVVNMIVFGATLDLELASTIKVRALNDWASKLSRFVAAEGI